MTIHTYTYQLSLPANPSTVDITNSPSSPVANQLHPSCNRGLYDSRGVVPQLPSCDFALIIYILTTCPLSPELKS